MRTSKRLVQWLWVVGVVAAAACGSDAAPDTGAEPDGAAESASDEATPIAERFAGTWELMEVARFDENDESLPAPVAPEFGSAGTLGYLTYDPAGYMGVVIMAPDRAVYSEDGPTADEARASMSSYVAYFGPFTIDEAEGTVTHHVVANRGPGGSGRDNVRAYELSGDQLTLRPPRGDSGVQLALTWRRVPEATLSPEQERFVGFWRIRNVERRTADGETEDVPQYANGYIIYTAAGHMQVHLERPDRMPFAGDTATDEEILSAVRTYTSYFGPFSVDPDEQVVTHERVGSTTPAEGRPTALRRSYEFRDDLLILSPVPSTPDPDARTYLFWERISAP